MFLTKTGDMSDVMRYIQPIAADECRRILEYNEELFEKLHLLKLKKAVVDGIYTMKCLYLVSHRLKKPWITHTHMVEPWLVHVP